MNDRLAILAFIGWSNWGRSDGTFIVLVVFFLMKIFILHGVVIAKVTGSLGSGRSRHELRIDGERWGEPTGGAGSARVGASVGESEEVPWRARNGFRNGGFDVE